LLHRSEGEVIPTSQANTMVRSGESHSQVRSGAANIIADGKFRMTKAKDKITRSAHEEELQATEKQVADNAASTKEVEIVATNKITLTAGGASITLDGGNITITAKQFTEKAGKHSKAGGGKDGLSLAGLPSLIAGAMYKAQFRFADDDDIPYSFVDYIAQAEITGEVFEGTTDEDGFTDMIYTSIEQ